MGEIALDASALLARLKDEHGASMVSEGLGASCISAVSHAEVVSHFNCAGMPADAVDAMLRPLPVDVVPADSGLADMAGRSRALTAEVGLTLGDRFCLALALRDGLPAWTVDRQWRTVFVATGVAVVVIR